KRALRSDLREYPAAAADAACDVASPRQRAARPHHPFRPAAGSRERGDFDLPRARVRARAAHPARRLDDAGDEARKMKPPRAGDRGGFASRDELLVLEEILRKQMRVAHELATSLLHARLHQRVHEAGKKAFRTRGSVRAARSGDPADRISEGNHVVLLSSTARPVAARRVLQRNIHDSRVRTSRDRAWKPREFGMNRLINW